jgi:nicotinamidase-related amidase
MGSPGWFGDVLRARQAQAIFQQPGGIACERRLRLLLVAEPGQLSALEQPGPVGTVRRQEAGGPVTHCGNNLARVIQHGSQNVANVGIDGQILHGAVSTHHEDDVVRGRVNVRQVEWFAQDPFELLEIRLLSINLTLVVVVVAKRETEWVYGRREAAGCRDVDLKAGGGEFLVRRDKLFRLIDYQPVQVSSVASMDRRTLVSNITVVAKTAQLFGVPVVLSTVNVKTGLSAPTIHQLAEVLEGVEQLDRTTMNAWEDEQFVEAVKATGRKKLIMTALWTEICLCLPALDALREGYDVYPVVDAVGGTPVEAHQTALQRMSQAGARLTSWTQLLGELQRDWARAETAQQCRELLFAVEGR